MKVAALKSKGAALYTVAPDTKLSECVITMAEQDIGSIIVMSGSELQGIITFREVLQLLARRQIENRSRPTPLVAELRADQVMIRRPVVATPDMEIDELLPLMLEQHQRYLPVVDGEVLVGVVSFHDVMRARHEQQKFENTMMKAYIADWPEQLVPQ